MTIRRHAGMFKPGQSGNPRGRAPQSESLAEIVRRTVDPKELCKLLLELARDRTAKNRDRVAAITVLADRGWGRPVTTVDIETRLSLNVDTGDKHVFAPLSEQVLAELAGQALLEPLPCPQDAEGAPDVIDVEGREIQPGEESGDGGEEPAG